MDLRLSTPLSVTDKSLAVLKEMPHLEELSLDHTGVTDKGVDSL